MQTPLQITFRHMESSPAVEARIREHVDHLERFHNDIVGCRVVIEAPSGHHRGAAFHVTVDLTIPGREFAMSNIRDEREAHVDVYVAIRDVFDKVKHLLHQQTVSPRSVPHDYDRKSKSEDREVGRVESG